MKTMLIGVAVAVTLALSAPAFAGSGGGAAATRPHGCNDACEDAGGIILATLDNWTLDALVTKAGAFIARMLGTSEVQTAQAAQSQETK